MLTSCIKFNLQNGISGSQSTTLSLPVKQKNKNDILNDIFDSQNENATKSVVDDDNDFNPRENTQSTTQSQNANADFGDFTSAFGNPTAKTKETSDEFADFTSAFNSSVTISNPLVQPQLPQTQINLMGATMPNINSPVTDNVNSSMFMNSQSASTPFTPMSPGNTYSQNPNMNSNLFDALQPQMINNQQSLNNNTGIL